jgi:peptide/nickel transport system substrate-binding protein
MTTAQMPGCCTLSLVFLAYGASALPDTPHPAEEVLVSRGEAGHYGGRLVVSQRTQPKTLNPVISVDAASREVIGLITADLIHINRHSQNAESALAKSWTVSPDGRRYVLHLRRGLRFSDGHAFDADDVLFTFRVYLDEKIHSPQRELLVIGGKPIAAQKLDAYTVQFDLAQPYAAAERLFDSIAILPRHLLQDVYAKGELAQAWSLATPASQLAGLGPFRVRKYIPGQHIALERNPYYWKADAQGNRLPYLNEIVSLFVGSADAEALRFEARDTDIVSRLSADNFSVLEKHQQARGFRVHDLGPGLEYNFLLFNLNDLSSKNLPHIAGKQSWFRQVAFRQAVSAAIDRDSIIRLVYRGRAASLVTQVTPGNKRWVNPDIPRLPHLPARAKDILKTAGFSWNDNGRLIDAKGAAVEFAILTNAENSQRTQTTTMIQDDLKQIGIDARIISIEFRSLLDRIFKNYEYEAAVMALSSGDADPSSEMNVWTLQGSTHLWNLPPSGATASWEEEIDQLMKRQLTTISYGPRKRLYDRVQNLVAANLPLIFLAAPHILVGAREHVGNFKPAILNPYTLWNAEELFLRPEGPARGR